ncbi:MAG: PAS domain S-box protein [Candidatus Zixiibacteriota bacterium]
MSSKPTYQELEARVAELEKQVKQIDITKRKIYEKELLELKEKILDAQSMAHLGFWYWDVKSGDVDWSDEVYRIFRLDPEQFTPQIDSIMALSPWPEDSKRNEELIQKAIESKEHGSFEQKFLRPDGSVGYFRSTFQGIYDDADNLTAIKGTVQDITIPKLAEVELRKSEERFRKYFELGLIGMAIISPEKEWVEFNDKLCEMLGYFREELEHLNWTKLTHPDDQEEDAAQFDRVIEGKIDNYSLEKRFIHKDGSILHAEISANAIRNPDGSVDYFVALIHDITETKRLRNLQSRAERLEMAGIIAGQVAHDFNNLLAPIMAFPEFIREDVPEVTKVAGYLDAIENSARRISEINQDLLTLGRRGHFNREVLNLNTIVKSAIVELQPLPCTLTCNIVFENELMPIYGAEAQLHRAIGNLLNNAREAMQDSGELTIKTESYYIDDVSFVFDRIPKGEYVKLTIKDTGCGIPDGIAQKIFDPFFTSKTTDKKRGSGLGMSIVNAVIKDHNGYIDLDTEVGKGTSFYIYLPISREEVTPQEPKILTGGTESILVVDDDETQCMVSSKLLSSLGYTVITVESGEKAIRLIKDNPQDLVILDMIMPGGIDGTETYRRILEMYPNQKAIILSGYSELDRVVEAKKLGAGEFVRKPITKHSIAEAVRKELDRKIDISI